jgi:glycosyltransferase involved in cell wall biosynthesis
MTLSLCMIVKDEAAQLGKCLQSVGDRVDEIIVVDTGSQDNTGAIATDSGSQGL